MISVRSFLGGVLPSVVILAFWNAPAVAGSDVTNLLGQRRCAAHMSCIQDAVTMSIADASNPKMSLAAPPDPPELSTCMDRFYFRSARDTVQSCELYLKIGKGTRREKAIALFVLGHAQTRINETYEDGMPSGTRNALDTWKKAIKLDSAYIEPYLAMGNALGLIGASDEAQFVFADALKLDPNEWRIFTGLAKAHRHARNYTEGLKAAERAKALKPDEPDVQVIYGLMLERNEKYEEAATEYSAARARFKQPNETSFELWHDENPWISLARIHNILGKPALAAETMTKYIDSLPPERRWFDVYQQRADYFQTAGLFGKAAEDLREAALRAPAELVAKFAVQRAILLVKSGSIAQAGDELHGLLERGSLNQILRIQVFLKNQGYGELAINGQYDAATKRALAECLQDKNCGAVAGQGI